MVRDTTLWIIISTDLGGTVACRDHGLALGSDLIKIFLMFKIVQTGSEFLKGPVLVLKLGTLLLALDHKASGKVGQPDSGICRVDSLSSRTGGTEQIKANVLPFEVHIELAGLREHGDRSLP